MKQMDIGFLNGHTRRMATGALCLFMAGPTMAYETAVWTNTLKAAEFTAAGNWTDAEGTMLTEPPTNGTWSLSLPESRALTNQTITLTGQKNPSIGSSKTYDFYFGTITANAEDYAPHRKIYIKNQHDSIWDGATYLHFTDTVGYRGLWSFAEGTSGFVLDATPEKDVHLSNISAAKRVDVNVPTAGTRAILETVYDAGALDKRGAGELEITMAAGSDSRIYVNGGSVTLGGHAAEDADDDVPVAGAWMHLDANRTDTMKYYTDDAGRLCVTNWVDVRGNGTYVYHDATWTRGASSTYLQPFDNAPFLNADVVANQKVVDFGSATASDGLKYNEPTNCVLRFCETRKDVREVFYAGQYHRSSSGHVMLGNVVDGYYPFHWAGGTSFVGYYDPTLPVRKGDIIFNGKVTDNYTEGFGDKFHTFSVGTTENIRLEALGTDRRYIARSGGLRLGEVLIFTNALTHAERVAVHDYLRRKWTLTNRLERCDVGSVVLAKAATGLGVTAGRTAHVTAVTTESGTLVKTGEGTLSLGSLSALSISNNPSIRVEAGEVQFKRQVAAPEVLAPAAGAYLWVDSTTDNFVISNKENDATQYVAEWHDCRPEQTAVYYVLPTNCPTDYAGTLPTLVENRYKGCRTVDFGPWCSSSYNPKTGTFLILNVGKGANVREAFTAQQIVNASAPYINPFGCNSITLYRASRTALLQRYYGNDTGHNGIWTVDGREVDPIASGQGALEFDFHVISAAFNKKVDVCYTGGKDRYAQGTGFGGIQIYETILYDRELTPAERRQTINYLTKRWFDAPSQGAESVIKLNALSFPDGRQGSLIADLPVEVANVAGTDSFVKRGSETLKLTLSGSSTLTNLTAEAGTLHVTTFAPEIDAAAYHFDASDTSTLSYFVTEDGARTNVTSVTDIRHNGLTANAYIKYPFIDNGVNRACFYTNPVWRVMETAEGISRPVFDFGLMNDYWMTSARYESAAALKMSKDFTTLRDVMAIYSDLMSDDGTTRLHDGQAFFGHSSSYYFMRGGSATLFNATYANPVVTNGDIRVDGVKSHPLNTQFPKGFHLIGVTTTGNAPVNAMAMERNQKGGGCRIGEFIGFTNVLSETWRSYLTTNLLHKWKGTARAVWPVKLGALHADAGATLAIDAGEDVISATTLSGAGTINIANLADIAELTVNCVNGIPDQLHFSGNVTFAPAVRVTLTGSSRDIVYGTYTILSATSLVADDTTWSVRGDLHNGDKCRIQKKDNTLTLTLTPPGTVIIVR